MSLNLKYSNTCNITFVLAFTVVKDNVHPASSCRKKPDKLSVGLVNNQLDVHSPAYYTATCQKTPKPLDTHTQK